jgi:hypothetical protein
MKNILAALFCLLPFLAFGGLPPPKNIQPSTDLASSDRSTVTPIVNAAVGNDVWIAVRTDGEAGSGSESDPFDGSTEPKFDALMGAFPANVVIHLLPGVFLTNGGDAWFVKPGWEIIGSGQGLTTLRLAGFSTDNHKHIILNSGSSGATGVEVHDLTLDGNYANVTFPAHDAVCGVDLGGSNIVVENVECINLYGDSVTGYEEFSILVGSGSAAAATSNCRIENCITHQYAITPEAGGYTFGPGIAYCNGGEILNCTDDGALHGFGGGIGDNTLIQGNTTTTHTSVGWYSDTSTLQNVTIADNWFGAGVIPLQWNNSNTGANIKIIDNTFVTANNSNPGNAAAIYLDEGGLSNVLITGNHVDYTGSGNYQFIANCGHNTSLTIEDNSGTATDGGYVFLSYTMSDIVNSGNSVGANNFEGYTQASASSPATPSANTSAPSSTMAASVSRRGPLRAVVPLTFGARKK